MLYEADKIVTRYEVGQKQFRFTPNYNVAPSQMFPVVLRNSPNKIRLMRWGLVPEWKKDFTFNFINIRAETTSDKPYFKKVLLHQRCIVPANGFFEWGIVNLEGKEEKHPFYFTLNNQEIFSMAGIYTVLEDAEKIVHYTFAILTCPPNDIVKPIHNRMPVILDNKNEDLWLDPDNNDYSLLTKLLIPYPEKMKFYPVSRRVNNPENNDPEVILEQIPSLRH